MNLSILGIPEYDTMLLSIRLVECIHHCVREISPLKKNIVIIMITMMIQYNTIQYNTTQHNTTQYNTIQYSKITLFKEGSAITFHSFLTYGTQKIIKLEDKYK